MEKYALENGDKKIEFELYRKNVKHINLRVRRDLSVMVSAPKRVPLEEIRAFVMAKSAWILRAQRHFRNNPVDMMPPRSYVSGETFTYLGRKLRLQVAETPPEGVKYVRGRLHLHVHNPADYRRKQKLIEVWFRERAEKVFQESLLRMYRLVEKYEIKQPQYAIRSMKSKWGSCFRHQGLIVLNLELIKTPKSCIDYVVLHELLHFQVGNHGQHFYALLTALMPDWKERQKILAQEVVRGL